MRDALRAEQAAPMRPDGERLGFVDCVRGIAILLVVLGHFDQGPHPLCKWLYSFHMPVFFVLSGMLTAARGAYAGQPLGRVLLHKAKRLLYPFFTFSLLVILYYILRGRGDIVERVIRDTVTLEGFNALWFLPALWMAECMLLVLLRSRLNDWIGMAVLAAGTTVYAALQYAVIGGANPAEEGLRFLVLNGLCRAGIGAVMMMAGYKGYQAAQRIGRIDRKKAGLAACACLALGAVCGLCNGMADLHYCVQHNPVLYYLAALLQSGGLIVLCACAGRRFAGLEFFGRNSLIVMATHFPLPLIVPVQALMKRMGTGARYADDLIGCALVMALEAGIILLINRWLPFLLRPPKRRMK